MGDTIRISDAPKPARIAALPVNAVGYPIPWFVATINGVPDFRVIAPGKIRDALRFKLCFTCGQPMGAYASFVVGPMCAVNRVSAEPPSHRECARYAALACPFLSTPTMTRRTNRMPEDRVAPGGVTLTRNPGVALVWTTRKWHVVQVDNGTLFDVGNPDTVQWYAQGRPATRAEVLHSIDTGLPALRAAAALDGPDALAAMETDLRVALALVPTE